MEVVDIDIFLTVQADVVGWGGCWVSAPSAEVAPAEMLNQAGIVGAALAAAI